MDTIKKDLTFIIPCHNLENFITPLLDSFINLNTEGLDVEYLFILDACNDNTQIKIEEKMKNLPYRIIHAEVHRCGLARNIGLDNSDSEFVWFIDGDDYLLQKDFLPNIIKKLRETNAPMIKLKFSSNNSWITKFPMMVWQYIYRRDFIGDLRFSSQQPGEDTRFMWDLFSKYNITKLKVLYASKKSYYYYIHNREGSNMNKFSKTGELQK